MSAYSLRPVTHSDRSSSPGSSTASDRTPPPRENRMHIVPVSPVDSSRPRRPLSPSIPIRDLDLPIDRNGAPRKYPAPPTGHELMALFPPPPPVTFPTGPTSGYFQKEERAFFAQAGKEIVRVRFEVDLKDGEDAPTKAPARPREAAAHQMPRPHPGPHPQLHPPPQHPPNHAPPPSFSPSNHPGRTPRPAPAPAPAPAVFQIPTHTPPQPPFPPNVHPSPNAQHAVFPLRTSSHERPHLPAEGGETLREDFRDDPDEAWRRPTPHNQRRRAGKHTKRVVVVK